MSGLLINEHFSRAKSTKNYSATKSKRQVPFDRSKNLRRIPSSTGKYMPGINLV